MPKDFKDIISRITRAQDAKEEEVPDRVRLVVFELDREEYAVPIVDIREIITFAPITPVPNAPEFIYGILNVRGKIIVVVDLEKRFHLVREHEAEPKHLVIADVGENSFGVVVDEVKEVLDVPSTTIQPAPELVSSKIHAEYVKGVVMLGEETLRQETKRGTRLILLLDLPKLLKEQELLKAIV